MCGEAVECVARQLSAWRGGSVRGEVVECVVRRFGVARQLSVWRGS